MCSASTGSESIPALPVTETIKQASKFIRGWKQAGETIAFVPTMGNLHAGHLALVKAASEKGRRVVVSIFVNPTQFGKNEDFATYPRTFDQDLAKLADFHVDMVFAPWLEELYPEGEATSTYIDVPMLSGILEGEHRASFFTGVVTVVNKLFNIIQPDVALFGEKDYQQLLVVSQMVHDLALPVAIQAVATEREPDGLAMSSRNAYLDANQRDTAKGLYRCLQSLVQAVNEGTDIYYAVVHASQHLEQQGFLVDYVVVRRQQELAVPGADDKSLIALAAVRLGCTRLIDNVPFQLKVPG